MLHDLGISCSVLALSEMASSFVPWDHQKWPRSRWFINSNRFNEPLSSFTAFHLWATCYNKILECTSEACTAKPKGKMGGHVSQRVIPKPIWPKVCFQFRINTFLFVLLTGLLLLLPAISWLFHYCIPGSLSTFFNLSLVYVSYTFKTFFQHHSFPQTFTSFSFSSHLPLALLMMCSSGLSFTVVSQHFQKLITFLLRCSWCKVKHQWDVMPADITGDWNPKEGRLSFIYLFKHFASGNTEE